MTISARSVPEQIGAAPQERQGAGVELREQSLLPARHRVRRDRSEIAEGQDVELAQVLLVLAEAGEVRDHPEVLEIPSLGHLAHHQVLADQELDPLDVLLLDAQALADRDGDPSADLAVRAAVGLADVVEQRSQRQRHRPLHLLDRLGGDRELLRVIAALERVQPPHRVQRVLVDGIDVIDVVLHAASGGLPLGHHGRQQTLVLHLLQPGRVGLIAAVADDLDEPTPRHWIVAQPGGGRRGQLGDELPRAQRETDVEADRDLEDANHLRRGALEHRRVGRLQHPVAHHEARVRGRGRRRQRAGPQRHQHRLRLAPRILPGRRALQEALGLVANQLGVGVVLVHQRLDRRVNRRPDDAPAIARLGVEHRRDRLLEGEAQVILAAPGRRVHRDPDPQQPVGRRPEGLGQPPRHHPLRLQRRGIGRPEAGRRRPPPHAEIAHPARPVLEVGLEQEDRVAEAAVAGLLLRPQPGHEVLGGRLGDAGPEGTQELVRQRLVPHHEMGVEQRRRRGQIGLGQGQGLVEGPHGVARVDLGVPERVEDRLRQLFHLGAGALGAQHQQVQVREGGELVAAKAAGGEYGDRGLALCHLSPGDLAND